MNRYRITVDTSYAIRAYEEIIVEAETIAKAKYKACKIFFNNKLDKYSMQYFFTIYHAVAEKVPDDTPLTRKYYVEKERNEYNGYLNNISFELTKVEELQ